MKDVQLALREINSLKITQDAKGLMQKKFLLGDLKSKVAELESKDEKFLRNGFSVAQAMEVCFNDPEKKVKLFDHLLSAHRTDDFVKDFLT
jgi:hypothetical protein